MYKHILVPTDGSDLSLHAVQSAVQLAKSLGAKISFLYVQPDFPLPIVGEGALLAPESRDEFAASTREQGDRVLRESGDIASREGVASKGVTSVSDTPYEVIISTAEAEHCDLVFMASHGRRGLAGLLIGSETNKVITHCKIPVLVFR